MTSLMSKHRTRTTKWSRLLSGVLCLALVLGLMPAAGLVQIAEAHWADPDGEKLVEWGVMMPSEDLRLGDTITRAEFVTMLNRAFGFSKLGGTPFTDVPYYEWYAEDIDIAYNAGYFMGGGDNKALPLDTLSREQATVLLARCMRLQETVGDNLDFSDGHDLSDWSRGLIGAAAAEGVINGLPDGTFSPANDITRGEVATMLVRAIGNPISTPGAHELGDVYGNVTISSSDVTLRDTVILGNLHITGGIDLGNVLLENVTVLGRIIISGGGESHEARSSVVLRNVKADELDVDSMVNQFVTISSYGLTDIPFTSVRSDTYLEDSCAPGYGLHYIEQNGANLLQLAGSIKEVKNKTPRSRLQLVEGTAEKITIDETAVGCELLVDINTVVEELNLDVASHVYGQGDIIDLNIGATGCEVDIIPEHVAVRPGITASVGDEVIGSVEAAEMSANPRLLAGYPFVTSLRPERAEGMYAGNKPGTIYWAVSASAKGSVSEANLLNPPAYGGNIHQSGSIDVTRASAEYAREITGLESDGSYYISAILVDDRGKHSPVKVISFSTPDDTVPDFVEEPRMTLVSCETAQVTAMANKSCMLYWVLLPAGAVAPTPANFESGSFGASYGSGSMSVVKNAEVSIKVNSFLLPESTDFDLYLWLDDFDGAMSSAVKKVLNESGNANDPSFTTPDETPPIITGPTQTAFGVADAQVSFGVSETPVTLYWAVTRENAPLIAPGTENTLQSQITVKSGTANAVIVRGTKEVTGDIRDTYYIEPEEFKEALTGSHTFYFYCVAEDADHNFSEVRVITIRTLDTDPPHAWLEFSNPRNDSPRADSNIQIVFDEEVQGCTENTFLALYEQVETFTRLGSGYTAQLTAAKNALAKELNEHFLLWSTGSDTQLKAKGDSQEDNNWAIDWHEATVTKANGNMIITIPNSALNLDSGAGYQFRLYNVRDLAQNPNAMAVDDGGVNCVKEGGKPSTSNAVENTRYLPRLSFTTVYALVDLVENTSVSSIKTKEADNALNGIRLDTVVDVIPEDTSKVPLTEVWDMIMWSDTVITVDIYRTKIKLDDNGKEVVVDEWKSVREGVIFTFPNAGKGLNELLSRDELVPVADGLQNGYIYRYGIHVTKLVVDEEEKDRKGEPDYWNGKIVMQFSLIAGTSGNVSSVSKRVNGMEEYERDENYNNSVRDQKVTEIGVTKDSGSILTCEPITFVDTKPPQLQSTYPTFDKGSNSITIKVSLDRPGTVYYMVAPVGSINTSIDGTTLITSLNDGTPESELPAGSTSVPPTASSKTYIPTDGTDIKNNEELIQFISGGGKDEDGEYVPGRYKLPDYLDISNQTNKGKTGVVTGSYKVESASAVEEIPVKGLEPLTTYYVYLVMKGGGNPGPIMEIYRVTTTDITPPVVEIASVNDTQVTMTVNNRNDGTGKTTQYDGGILYYALVNASSLPDIFTQYYNWAPLATGQTTENRGPYTGATIREAYKKFDSTATDTSTIPNTFMTVLDAMIKQYTGAGEDGRTYFDRYARDFGTLMDDVMNYISTTSTDNRFQTPAYRNTAGTTTNPMPENFANPNRMTDTSEYIVLACARNVNSAKGTGSLYGFAAARSLYKRDTDPPVFVPYAEYPQYIMLEGPSSNPDKSPEPDNRTDLIRAAWTGSITVNFNKDVYFHDSRNSKLYNVSYQATGLGSDQIYILADGVLGGSAVSHGVVKRGKTTGTVGGTIVLDVAGIKNGETIVFFASGKISNADDYTTDYRLTLTFDTTLTYESYGITDTYLKGWTCPGFRVSWVEVKTN